MKRLPCVDIKVNKKVTIYPTPFFREKQGFALCYMKKLSDQLDLIVCGGVDSTLNGGGYLGKIRNLVAAGLVVCVWIIWKLRSVIQAGWLYHSMSYDGDGFTVFTRAIILSVACIWIWFLCAAMPERKIFLISSMGQFTWSVEWMVRKIIKNR